MGERRLPWARRALVSPPPKHQTLYDDQPQHDAHDHQHDDDDDYPPQPPALNEDHPQHDRHHDVDDHDYGGVIGNYDGDGQNDVKPAH